MSDRSERLSRLSARLSEPVPATHKPDTVHGDGTWEAKNVRATYWVPVALRDAVKAAAEAEGISLAQWVQRSFRRSLGEGES